MSTPSDTRKTYTEAEYAEVFQRLLQLLGERSSIMLETVEYSIPGFADCVSYFEMTGAVLIDPPMWERRNGKMRKRRASYRSLDLLTIPDSE